MAARRLLVLLIGLSVVAGIGALLLLVLAPGGWTAAKLVMLGSFIGGAPWLGLCAANGVIGFVLLVMRRDDGPVGAVADIATLPRTAIAVTVRHEDMRAVLPPLRRLLEALDRAGTGHAFAAFLLSDSSDPDAIAAEEQAVAAARAREPERIRYRRRARHDGFKAGNLLDFVDHHAAGFELMLVLDADSRMSADAVLRLVGAMQAEPSLGIVQHLAVGLPAAAPFPRLFQFGMRAGMRSWATAIAWWQGDECCYWGHNAVVRIAPFRAHGRLPLLPGGRPILSHDQMEAALLRGAGWGIRLLPEEDGSAEASPPALPELLHRERRWMEGNFAYRHLLRMPGLRPMGRWQLVQAILLFAGAPFQLAFLLAAALAAATDAVSPFPAAPALALTLGWAGALHAPRLLGYAELLLSRRKRAAYGGAARLLAGIGAEIVFTQLLDPISAVSRTLGTARLALGWPAGWAAQNRTDREVSWSEAARLLWPQTLLGAIVFAAFAGAGPVAVLWAAPFAGGLLTAIPFCVLTADRCLGRWMRRRGLAAIPEETALSAGAGDVAQR